MIGIILVATVAAVAGIVQSTPPGQAVIPRSYLPAVMRSWKAELINSSFEGGQWQAARWWIWPWHDAYTMQFNEVRPPEGWVAWWVERMFCPRYQDYKTGRPEVTLADLSTGFPDPLRVADGDKAVKWFTFWRCHYGGLYQVLDVSPGRYRVSVLAHSWYTDCSSRLHDPPYAADCRTRLDDHAWISVGLDPMGGEAYWSDTIQWSDRVGQYGRYGERIVSSVVETTGPLTIWIRSETEAPLKHDDLYLDGIRLERLP